MVQDYEDSVSDGVQSDSSGNQETYGCQHYQRKCKLVAPCCGKTYWCRHCHNQENAESEPDPKKRHTLDRKAVTELVCAVCSTRQPVGEKCVKCGTKFGKYSCLKCNFFEDDLSKEQYHCEHCGICRVGGRENYFHCQKCNCCYHINMKEIHVCVVNSMHQNCPVCCEYLFDSTQNISVLHCGHTIHTECLEELMEHGGRKCPVCSKSLTDMSRTWRALDEEVANTPMPDEYVNTLVDILCNDCSVKSEVHFHVFGHKCPECGSYNTARR
ncbi:hypothetical protein BSKO_00587 [Bryopsis sp. KO-2023]|nr:hypothetical protein BSKO_00587 [Bryopsis sp. KO-2023]